MLRYFCRILSIFAFSFSLYALSDSSSTVEASNLVPTWIKVEQVLRSQSIPIKALEITLTERNGWRRVVNMKDADSVSLGVF